METNYEEKVANLDLTAQAEEYQEIWEQWKTIDTKAQGAISIGGVIISGIFIFVQNNAVSTAVLKLLVASSIVVVVIAVGFAVSAIRIRTVDPVPLGNAVSEKIRLFKSILESEKLQENQYVNLLKELARDWKHPLEENKNAVLSKATYLWHAQRLTLLSLGLIAAATIIRIL